MAGDPACEGEVGAHTVLDESTVTRTTLHRIDDVDVDRPEVRRVAPVGWGSLRREHADLLAVVDHAERRVGDVAVRVQAHGDSEVRRAVAVVPVEEVAVVEVDVGARRFRHRNGGLMDRVVVVATQHSRSATVAWRGGSASTDDQAGSGRGLHPRRVPQDLRFCARPRRRDRRDRRRGSPHRQRARLRRLAELQRLRVWSTCRHSTRRSSRSIGSSRSSSDWQWCSQRSAPGCADRADATCCAVDVAGGRHPGARHRRRDRGVDRSQPGGRATALRAVDGAGGDRRGAGHSLARARRRQSVSAPWCREPRHRVRLLVVWTALAILAGTVVTGTGPHAGDEKARRFTFLSITWVTRIHSVIVWVAVLMALSLLWHLRRRPHDREVLDAPLTLWMCVAIAQGVRRLPAVCQRGAGNAGGGARRVGHHVVGDVGLAVVLDVAGQWHGRSRPASHAVAPATISLPRLRTNSESLSMAEEKNEPIEPMKLTVRIGTADGSCHSRITRKATKR